MSLRIYQLAMVVVLVSIQASVGYKRVCYYTNWSQYRGQYGFFPGNIPPHLCTHIFYAFARLTGNTIEPMEWNDDSTPWSQGMYEKIVALKTQNPSLKILVSIGGWISDDESTRTQQFRLTANSPSNRATFIQNAIQFIRSRNLDGLDVDWEYPRPTDSHLELMQELRQAFDAEGLQTSREPLLLAAAVWGNAQLSGPRYRMSQLGLYMDFIGIMSYDYYGSWDNQVKQHSILYSETDDAVNLWLNNGFPASKLLIGIATYGRSFRLASSSRTNPGSPAVGPGTRGPISKQGGFLSYLEVCYNIKHAGWSSVWDSGARVPYAFNGDQWVGYDNRQSVALKMNYVVQRGLGGAMVWTLDFDDFLNRCGDGTFPLIRAIQTGLSRSSSPGNGVPASADTPTTKAPTTKAPTTKAPAIQSPSNNNSLTRVVCSDAATPNGIYPNPSNCHTFIQCVHNKEYILSCPSGLLYDPRERACNWESIVLETRADCR